MIEYIYLLTLTESQTNYSNHDGIAIYNTRYSVVPFIFFKLILGHATKTGTIKTLNYNMFMLDDIDDNGT